MNLLLLTTLISSLSIMSPLPSGHSQDYEDSSLEFSLQEDVFPRGEYEDVPADLSSLEARCEAECEDKVGCEEAICQFECGLKGELPSQCQ